MSVLQCLGYAPRTPSIMVVAAISLFAGPAFARERPPLAEPLPCPIDAPLRVASEDTLKHFSIITAMCDSVDTIVSPAITLPKVSPIIRIEPEPELHHTGTPAFAAKPVVRTTPVALAPKLVEPGPVTGQLTDEAILALRPRSYRTAFDAAIAEAAARHRVDPLLLHAVITQESAYRSSAVSRAGARGLMQVMPGTGAMLGTPPSALLDPRTNINTGAKLLRRMWSKFGGRFDLVLAAYNAGDGAVIKYGYRVPPYAETQGYVARVRAVYARLAAESSLAVPGL